MTIEQDKYIRKMLTRLESSTYDDFTIDQYGTEPMPEVGLLINVVLWQQKQIETLEKNLELLASQIEYKNLLNSFM